MLSAERRHRPTRRVIRPLSDRQTDTRINTTVLIRAHHSISDHKCHPQNPPKCHQCPDTEPSPKSKDITGAGWADRERTLATRTALFSHRTRGWDLSHLQEIAVLAGCRIPRYTAGVRRSDAAGTVCRPAAARALREAGGSLCVRGAGPCRRSLSAPGMDCGPPRLSQSDSRLGVIELTELDSTTILSAYDST